MSKYAGTIFVFIYIRATKASGTFYTLDIYPRTIFLLKPIKLIRSN